MERGDRGLVQQPGGRGGGARIDGDGALTAHLLVEERLIHGSDVRPLPSKIIVMCADLTRAQAQAQAHWRAWMRCSARPPPRNPTR